MNRKSKKTPIYFIVALILIVLTISIVILAVDLSYTDEQTGINWSFVVNSDEQTATITTVTLTKQTKEFSIPSTVSDGTNTYTVTAIKDGAFNGNKKVFGKLTIPNTVTSIGSSAFKGTYIYGKVVIPESVKTIGSYAFEECDGITEVVLPTGITTLSKGTFKNCFALNKVHTEKIVTFGEEAFSGCRALHQISFGPKAETINGKAFYDCDSLDGNIDLSMIKSISNNAFEGCDGIKSFTIPDNPDKDKHDLVVYSYCPNVEALYTTDNNKNYKSIDGVLHDKEGTTILFYPTTRRDTKFTFSESVTTIGENAFKGTKYLEEVIINEKITALEDGAFSGSSIKFIYIPDNVKRLGYNTFKDCLNLERVVFGAGVELIGTGTFTNTPKLKLVIAKNDMLSPSVSNGQFYYASEYLCVDHIYGYTDKAPTCTEYGYNVCIVCDRHTYVKETNHNGAIIDQQKATCTTDGYRTIECFDCGQTVNAITEVAIGHISNGDIVHVPSSYRHPEFKYSTCVNCKNPYIYEFYGNFLLKGDVNCDGKISFLDLDLLKSYIKDSSSVTEYSKDNIDVNDDNVVDQKDVDMLEGYLNGLIESLPDGSITCRHNQGKETITITVASCDTPGFRIRVCKLCGNAVNGTLDERIVPQLQHQLIEKIFIQNSCTIEGQRVSECSVCNKTVYETIKKAPHTQRWFTVAGQKGYEYSKCSVCGEIESRTVDYSKLDLLIEQIPTYYTVFYQLETIRVIETVKNNANKTLTQAEVDDNASILTKALINPKYVVFEAPTIFIEDRPASQGDDYVPTSILILSSDENGNPVVEALDYNSEIRIRGKTSATHDKRPYNIKFSSKVDLFGLGAGKKYCLLANWNDNTLLRNALMFETSELLGIPNSCRYTMVDVYTKGGYNGSYLLTTPTDVGENRIEISEETDFLLEIEMKSNDDESDKECYNITSPIFNIYFKVNTPEMKDMTPAALSSMYTTVANIDFAIMSGDWELIKQYVDVESVAKYYVLHELCKEIDIFWDSTRFYIKEGKLYGGPGWDFDLSMIYNGGGGQGESSAHSNSNGWLCEGGVSGDSTTGVWASIEWKYKNDTSSYRIWFCALYLHSPDFVKLVSQTIINNNDKLSLIYEDQLDENGEVVKVNVIDTLLEEHKATIANNRGGFIKFNGTQQGAVTRETYENNVNAIRNWLKRRNEWMQRYYSFKLESFD